MHDETATESARARALARAALERLWAEHRITASLAFQDPATPFALLGTLRGRDGELLGRFSAHADATNLLIGEEETLCAFDDGTTEQRVERLVGAIVAVLSLHDLID